MIFFRAMALSAKTTPNAVRCSVSEKVTITVIPCQTKPQKPG